MYIRYIFDLIRGMFYHQQKTFEHVTEAAGRWALALQILDDAKASDEETLLYSNQKKAGLKIPHDLDCFPIQTSID